MRIAALAAGALAALAAALPAPSARAAAALPAQPLETRGGFAEPRYSAVLPSWVSRAGEAPASPALSPVPASPPSAWETRAPAAHAAAAAAQGRAAVFLAEGGAVDVPVDVPVDGLWQVVVTYWPKDTKPLAPEISISVDGAFPFAEARRIVLPVRWHGEGSGFATDRFGNELLPVQMQERRWYEAALADPGGLQAEPFSFFLPHGRHVLAIGNLQGPFLVSSVTLRRAAAPVSYAAYRAARPSAGAAGDADPAADVVERVEAESPAARTSPSVRAAALRDPGARPYDTRRGLMNALDGATWRLGGQEAAWRLTVPADGWYRLVLAARQDQPDKAGSPVFRRLRVDGAVPFAEAASIMVPPRARWTNIVLGSPDGTPYELYLARGTHEISLEVDDSAARPVLETIDDVLARIRRLSVDVRKITGNTADRYRDWTITDYIPDVPGRLGAWAAALDEARAQLVARAGTGERSREALGLRQAADTLRALAARPEEIPRSLGRLSEGTGSAAQVLGDLVPLISSQPLTVDALYLAGARAVLPRAGAPRAAVLWEGVKRFALSFAPRPYEKAAVETTALRVWINRPRQYLPLLQSLVDARFTPATGIRVQLSLNTDDGKIILANAAGRQPDVSLSIQNALPFDMGLRGAAADLRQFPGFADVVPRFAPGAFLPYIGDDRVFGLPETQDFWVLYYRRDILASLRLAVPDTWADVTAMLPVLQRYGMNFYLPLGGAAGVKAIYNMVPFIYQEGGDLYSADGTRAGIDSENALRGVRLMTDLYTVYSLPLQTPNFYDRFRTASLPIGVSNFTDYVRLATAAPEIAGWWAIAPHPGVRQADGQVVRWVPGSAQAALVFQSSQRRADAWAFLEWWTSTEAQGEFQSRLRASFGAEALWNSANVEAFAELPIPRADRDVILAQWLWMREVPKVPGSYMLERELSNAWSRVVFNGENPRQAIDQAVVTSNREIARKLEEFGYMKDGVPTRAWHVPDIALVQGWGRSR